jgi:hypothetical protein
MAYAGDYSLFDLTDARPDIVVISPNAPQAMIRYPEECKKLKVDYIYDPSQQIPRLDDDQLRRGIEGARALFVNHYEFLMIQNRLGIDINDITSNSRFAVVTHGEYGIKTYSEDQVLDIMFYHNITKCNCTSNIILIVTKGDGYGFSNRQIDTVNGLTRRLFRKGRQPPDPP